MTVAERQDVVNEIDPVIRDAVFEHPGKWVSMTRTEILAVTDSPEEAYEAAQERGVETPLLYLVPTGETGVYYY